MTARELSDWIYRATRNDATLSNSTQTGVMFCPIGVVKASLKTRKVKFAPGRHELMLRLQLRDILQLEQEYTRMTLHMKDGRFNAAVPCRCAVHRCEAPCPLLAASAHADARESADVTPSACLS
jgi:hypothetical protein